MALTKLTSVDKSVAKKLLVPVDAALAVHTADIETNTNSITDNTTAIAVNAAAIVTNTSDITAIEAVDVTQNDRLTTNEASITALIGSQTGGLISYLTFQELVTAGLQTQDSFKVTNDPSSNLNGYYHWVSGTTYTKDADLVVNTIDANNTSDAVSGKAVADYIPQFSTASGGAGYKYVTPSVGGVQLYSIPPNSTTVEGRVNEPSQLIKVSGGGGSSWYGFHLKIPFEDLAELDKEFFLNGEEVSGDTINTIKILKGLTDWGPSSQSVSVSLSVFTSNQPLNIYESIIGAGKEAEYSSLDAVYISINKYTGGSAATNSSESVWTINPSFSSEMPVLASEIRPTLKASLLADVDTAISTAISDISLVPQAVSAEMSAGAGYYILGDNTPEFDITTRGTQVVSQGFGEPIRLVQTSATSWYSFYFRIAYDTLEDLDKELMLNLVEVSGVAPDKYMIMSRKGDWSPASNAVYLSKLDYTDSMNIYDSIVAQPSDRQDIYRGQNELFVMVGYYGNGNNTDVVSEWSIEPRFASARDVVATHLSSPLRDELIELTSAGISTLLTDKLVLSNAGTGSNSSSNTASVTNHTNFYNEVIGFTSVLQDISGYAYSHVKVFQDYTTIAAAKTIKVNVSSDRAATVRLRATNATAWGSSSGSVGTARGVSLNLHEGNNYTSTIEIDYSHSDFSDFYAVDNRLQAVYLILVAEGERYPEPVTFNTYCYEVTESSTASDMTSPTLLTADSLLVEANSKILALENDVIALRDGLGLAESIVCWGDSLTRGGGWTSRLSSLSGLPVLNAATGGENSRTIVARQGGDVMVANNITIPTGQTAVLIADRSVDGGISTSLGYKVSPLYQGGSDHVNPCMIGDVEGTLRWTGSNYADTTGDWTFTRNADGEEVVITRPTAIRTAFDINHNGGIQILFIGQNGGYSDLDDLVLQHRRMIDHSKATTTIVLGLSSGTEGLRADYEARFKLEFGRYFISLREYLAFPIYDTDGTTIISSYGLDDAGITPTSSDLTMLASGRTPASLLSDAVHFNSACKTVIGNMLYKKMLGLNVF